MPDDARLSIEELRALESQVLAQPADGCGTVLFLKDGMLAVIRAAIAAEKALSVNDAPSISTGRGGSK